MAVTLQPEKILKIYLYKVLAYEQKQWSRYYGLLFLFYGNDNPLYRPGGNPKTHFIRRCKSTDKSPIDFATVYLKNTNFGCTTNEKGEYRLNAPAGEYILVVSAIGFETYEKSITIGNHHNRHRVTLKPSVTELDEVVVVSNGVSRLKRSAFNAVAVDTRELQTRQRILAKLYKNCRE